MRERASVVLAWAWIGIQLYWVVEGIREINEDVKKRRRKCEEQSSGQRVA